MPSRRIVPRSEWGAKHGRGHDVSAKLPWNEVVVHTEAGALRPQDWAELTGKAAEYAALNAAMTEIQKIRAIESFHAVTRGWDGIAYSFLFTFDGTIFEGRGWGRSGAHTEGRNSTAAGFCFLGHGDVQPATEAQWASAEWLIAEGKRLGHITPSAKVSGHRDYSLKGKTCPGTLIYPRLDRLRKPTKPTVTDEEIDMATAAELERRIAALESRTSRLEAGWNILKAWIIDKFATKAAFDIVTDWTVGRVKATTVEIEALKRRVADAHPGSGPNADG